MKKYEKIKLKSSICKNFMEMTIHQETHQNHFLHVSKCKHIEAYFVDFYTT